VAWKLEGLKAGKRGSYEAGKVRSGEGGKMRRSDGEKLFYAMRLEACKMGG